MQHIKRHTGRASTMAQGLLIGSLVGLATILLTTMVMAKLIDLQLITWDSIGVWILAILLIASAIGSWMACRMIKHRKLLICTMNGTCLWILLICITALFFGGQYDGVILEGILIYAGSIVTFLLSLPKAKHTSRIKVK